MLNNKLRCLLPQALERMLINKLRCKLFQALVVKPNKLNNWSLKELTEFEIHIIKIGL
jgi:hypothetical protein